jgi:pimeloyl-ACP methyl ester carboxylesterase
MLMLLAGVATAAQISLTAADGTRLKAAYAGTKGAEKGVVLVHMLGRSSGDWDYLAERLSHRGLRVIAPDLRGHGASAKSGNELAEADYLAMKQDVVAAIAWLRKDGAKEISCVGASIGANLCLQAAAEDPNVGNLVLLSPGLKYKGVTSGEALDAYGERPVLLVASEEDRYAAKSTQVLDQRAKGQHHFALLESAGHGTKMLNRDPSLEGTLTSWLLGTFQLSDGTAVIARPAGETTVGEVETTGQKLDVHQ